VAEAGVAGPEDGLGAVGHLELGEDRREVVGDRLGAKGELVGDLVVGAARELPAERLSSAAAG